jgi:hypothetical protein
LISWLEIFIHLTGLVPAVFSRTADKISSKKTCSAGKTSTTLICGGFNEKAANDRLSHDHVCYGLFIVF